MKTLTLTIPGFTIAYKAWGNPENPPIVALHGWLDNANSFDQLAKLLEHDYYFIAVDLPGHGHSSHLPAGCHYHFIDGLFTIVAILNALPYKKVHLIGHSMGACLSSLVGGVVPERFISIGLIEGIGPFSNPAELACKQLSEYVKYVNHKVLRSSKGYNKMEEAVLARSMKGYVSLEIAQTLCERGIMEEKGQYYWRHDKRLLVPSPLKMTEEQILSCLEGIDAPTCLLWASKGFSFDSTLMKNRIDTVKNITVKHLEGGHHIHMEKPEEVALLLAQFYQSL